MFRQPRPATGPANSAIRIARQARQNTAVSGNMARERQARFYKRAFAEPSNNFWVNQNNWFEIEEKENLRENFDLSKED